MRGVEVLLELPHPATGGGLKVSTSYELQPTGAVFCERSENGDG